VRAPTCCHDETGAYPAQVRAASDTVSLASRPTGSWVPGLQRRVASAWTARRDPHVRLQVALALAFVAAMAAFAHVVEDYLTGDPLVRWDVELSHWLHEHSSPSLVSVSGVLTFAGNVAFLALLTAVTTLVLLRRRRLNEAAVLCAAALGVEVVNALLKLLFQRPRPELAYVHLDTYSFPSGHTAGSAAIYGVMLYLLARRAALRLQVLCAAGYVALVVGVGFSRLYLEAHYLSDVLAGASLGAACAAAYLFVYESRNDAFGRLLPRRARELARRVGAPR
jgi:undecaprenyl-diphosphatase